MIDKIPKDYQIKIVLPIEYKLAILLLLNFKKIFARPFNFF